MLFGFYSLEILSSIDINKDEFLCAIYTIVRVLWFYGMVVSCFKIIKKPYMECNCLYGCNIIILGI